MSIYVMFTNEDGTAEMEGRKLICGPYDSVELAGSQIYVMEGRKPFALASSGPDGWRVNDGMGAQTESYRTVLFLPRLLDGERPQL